MNLTVEQQQHELRPFFNAFLPMVLSSMDFGNLDIQKDSLGLIAFHKSKPSNKPSTTCFDTLMKQTVNDEKYCFSAKVGLIIHNASRKKQLEQILGVHVPLHECYIELSYHGNKHMVFRRGFSEINISGMADIVFFVNQVKNTILSLNN